MTRQLVTFNKHELQGYHCECGEKYYESAEAQEILLNNKAKLGHAN